MNKIAIIKRTGGPEEFVMETAPTPTPAAGDILVRNTAIGLNFIDIYQRKGLYPVSMPAVLGQEGAGIVEAVGDEVRNLKPGDRVAHLSGRGAYADLTLCPAGLAAKIPSDVTDESAAAVFLKGLTAQMLVRQVVRLGADHSCLIYAAVGGVGTLLTQWARHLGARVIGVVGSEEKIPAAKANGCEDVILRTQTDSIASAVRELTNGAGVDVVYDSVGAATFEASLNALAIRGHMVSFGNASGPVPAVQPLDLSRRGSLTLTRPSLFHYATPERLPAMADELFARLSDETLRPAISNRFALEDIADAHRLLESGDSAGAIIIKP